MATAEGNGPPNMERDGPRQEAVPHHDRRQATEGAAKFTRRGGGRSGEPLRRCVRTSAQQEALAALDRRRVAAKRSVPLQCGCRDPHECRCWRDQSARTERLTDAARYAAEHILEAGYTPLLDLETLRALWRRGGSDRRLAQRLAQLGMPA